MNKIVCLTSPPSRSFNHFRPPLALLYLAGYLEKNGIKTEIVDITLEKQTRDSQLQKAKKILLKEIQKKILEKIKEINPFIVGITCYSPEYYEVLNLARQIKKINKKINIVVGGIHPTLYPQDFIFAKSNIDVAVIGEGEITFCELTRYFDNKTQWPKIKSIAYFDEKLNKAIIAPPRPPCLNLDNIAKPAYYKINMEYYTVANPYAIRGVFTRSMYLLSSRGCPSTCTFCVSKKLREISGPGGICRLRSPANLLAEILSLKKDYHIDSFYFIDDLFTQNKKNVIEFCDLLKNSRCGLLWGCSSKVTTVDFSLLKKMKEAGCVQIDFGVERGSNRALSLIKKGITVEKIKQVFAYCRTLGIRTFANFLVNLPEETENDLKDITNLLDIIKPTIVSLNVFTPYPGTEIFDTFKRNFTRTDYPDMMENPCELIEKQPLKYKFSLHHLNLADWTAQNSQKYNKVAPTLFFHFSSMYLKNFFRSRKKTNYFKMAGQLIREFFYQKYGL